VGDEISTGISSTRAINIDAPVEKTWSWLMQLGADRGGFFSYYFIEKPMGYTTRKQDIITADFPDFKVGDVVRGSIYEDDSLILYNFPVHYVDRYKLLVLDDWGTFKLVPLGPQKTRLIIRTHNRKRQDGSPLKLVDRVLGDPLHFIMERATLEGIKKRVEHGEGEPFSDTKDRIWFGMLLLNIVLVVALSSLCRVVVAIPLSFVGGVLWIFSIFFFPPTPVYMLVSCLLFGLAGGAALRYQKLTKM